MFGGRLLKRFVVMEKQQGKIKLADSGQPRLNCYLLLLLLHLLLLQERRTSDINS